MYEHVMVQTLSGTFNAISVGGGGNVYKVIYTLTLSLSEGYHLLFCVLDNVVSENRSVQNSPWGVYSQLKAYTQHIQCHDQLCRSGASP